MKDETSGITAGMRRDARIRMPDEDGLTLFLHTPVNGDSRPRTFIHSDVMDAGNAKIRLTLAHEMIHAAGKPGRGRGGVLGKSFARIFGYNDLSYMGDQLDRIIEAYGHNR